ncbi:MAG: hypothetical protein ACJ71N_03075 [Terriglobales bacterium]|jgi:hypothetical protein
MTRWVSFDESAADAVRNAGGQPTLRSGDALATALRAPGNSVVIMPTRDGQQAAILSVIKRERVVAPVIEFTKSARIGQATGFLGLTDEPEFDDDPVKKPWWKKW